MDWFHRMYERSFLFQLLVWLIATIIGGSAGGFIVVIAERLLRG